MGGPLLKLCCGSPLSGFLFKARFLGLYEEMMVSPLAYFLLHFSLPYLLLLSNYILVYALGHWVSGTVTVLSVLFLFIIKQRHIWFLQLLVVLYMWCCKQYQQLMVLTVLMRICGCLCTHDGDVAAVNMLLCCEYFYMASAFFLL